MNYLLDFDHTLMDTERLKRQVAADDRLHMVGTPEMWEHYSGLDFLYDDVLPWLATKPKESLHILTAFKPSQGPLASSFQAAKIASDGFAELVGSVTVMEGMKGEVAASISAQFPPHEPLVFIDDRLEQCLSVKEALPNAHCFLMVRDGDFSGTVPAAITVVSDLAGVDAIMNQL